MTEIPAPVPQTIPNADRIFDGKIAKKEGTLGRNLANLVKVKTIITLVMVTGATVFVANGTNMPDWFIALVTSIVTFYFTKQEATS